MQNVNIKLSGPNSVISLKWTLEFEWCAVECGSKNGHQKDMCLKAIDLLVHNLLTTLNLIISVIWYFFHSCNFF